MFNGHFCAHQSCFNRRVTLKEEVQPVQIVFSCSAFLALRWSASVNVSPQTLEKKCRSGCFEYILLLLNEVMNEPAAVGGDARDQVLVRMATAGVQRRSYMRVRSLQ